MFDVPDALMASVLKLSGSVNVSFNADDVVLAIINPASGSFAMFGFIGRVGRQFNFRRTKPTVRTDVDIDESIAVTSRKDTTDVKVGEIVDTSVSSPRSDTNVKTGLDTVVVSPDIKGDE